MMTIDRRRFLSRSAGLAVAATIPAPGIPAPAKVARESGVKLKLGLNAYSFDKALRDGSMTLADTVHFCAQHSVNALDPTGYYFPGYPAVPTDDYIFNLKRTAFVNGVAISGAGVRNDFAVADEGARKKDVQMVTDWIVVASKLGAPVIRVFSGRARPEGHNFSSNGWWRISKNARRSANGTVSWSRFSSTTTFSRQLPRPSA
jgi:sugar phosphate isomerase/epimerase